MTIPADTLADAAGRNGAPPSSGRDSPYLGLSFYTEDDAALFFGRDGERQVIMGNLRASRLTLLYAQSGVGKSSLLRAGVAARLRALARESLDGAGGAPHVPVVFSAWKDDPVQELIDEILTATNALLGESHAQFDLPRDSLKSAIDVAVLALDQAVASSGSERAGSTLLIILDQFEEYFLYRAREPRVERFADELAECINLPGLRANFLISIREDAYSALGDLLRGRMSNVYGNYLHLEYLDAKAARAAIEKPVEYFNSTQPEHERVTIEPGLVEAVLEQVRRDPDEQAGDGHGPAAAAGAHRMEVATPYLQLVMSALWSRERAEGSSVLRLSALEELHGAQTIVARHLSDALAELGPTERELAVDVLHHLVTPSGTKIALEVADLCAYTGQYKGRVAGILKTLAGPERILREVPPAPGKSGDDETARRYEIYHDVLAGPINDAVAETATRRLEREKEAAEQRARQEQRRARIFKALAIAAAILFIIAVVAVILARKETTRAQRAERAADAGLAEALAVRAQSDFSNGDLVRGVLMSVQAFRSRPTADAHSALVTAAEATQGMQAYLVGHTGEVSGVDYSPEGRILASSSYDGTVILWNTVTDRPEARLNGDPSAEVTDVAVSPDGSIIAASFGDGRVALWSRTTHARLRTLSVTGVPAETIAFDPGTGRLAVADAAGTVRIWDPRSGRLLRTLAVSSQPVYGVAFVPGRDVVVAGGVGGAVTLWRVATRRQILQRQLPADVYSVAVSPDGALLAAATGASVVEYSIPTGRVIRTLKVSNAGGVQTVAFSRDGRFLAAGTAGSGGVNGVPANMVIWNSASGAVVNVVSLPARIDAVAFSPDGGSVVSAGVASAGTDPALIVWDAHPTPGLRMLTGPTGPVSAVAFSPDGRIFAATGSRGNIALWDVASGRLLRMLPAGGGGDQTLAFSPDGRTLASGGTDTTVILWDVQTARRIRVLAGHADTVFGVAFSPDGRLVASGGADQAVMVSKVATGATVYVLHGHREQVNAVAFSPDGTTLASAGADDLIDLWRVSDGHLVRTMSATRPVVAVAFSPHGNTLASAGADHQISLWDARTGQLVGSPLGGPQDNITSIAFAPSGRLLVSGSGDGSALVWSVKRGVAVPVGDNAGAVQAVALSPAGDLVGFGRSDGTVTLAPVPAGIDAAAISARLCSVVRQNLTPGDWHEWIPNHRYQRTCPQ